MEKMTKHTKGEWIRDKNFVYSLIQDGWDKGKPLMVNKFWLSVDGHKNITQEEKEANARLIASAPDLLQALHTLLETMRPHIIKMGIRKGFSEYAALAQAQTAIHKATGE